MLPRKLLPFARVLKERFPGILIEIVRFFHLIKISEPFVIHLLSFCNLIL